jgi:uncharacterized protein
MNRQLTATSTLENLKKEAKRWLKALHAGDGTARIRFERASPDAPTAPILRDVQHALALEHGLAGWSALKKELEVQALANKQRTELVDLFLENACADPILANGPSAHARRSQAALRILIRHPEIAHHSIHTAVVCGDLKEVKHILKEHPEAATEPGGPMRKRLLGEREKLWTPLLHLCYGRLPTTAAKDNAVAIAHLLLNHGANPNDFFEVGSHPCRYTALCGVAGEGEDDAPPHPQREALARLLLERGAEPYDIQLLYNMHFHGDILWILELIYAAAVKAGRQADWDDPAWSMIDMGGLDSGARYLLGIAVAKNDLKLTEWLLAHKASPNATRKPNSKFPARSLHEEALRQGSTEMTELLERFGAVPSAPVAPEDKEVFIAACFQLDHKRVQAIIEQHPEYLLSSAVMFAAVRQNRVDVVTFLLDIGMSIEIEDEQKQRPLHEAVSHDSFDVAVLLIERGAEIDPVESNWGATPLGFAIYGQKTGMIELLGRVSRDIWELTNSGQVERLRELLSQEPELAKVAGKGVTPLMWLPDDETRAIEIVELLLAYGADPAVRNNAGMTAADCVEKRGLYDVAELLRSSETQ